MFLVNRELANVKRELTELKVCVRGLSSNISNTRYCDFSGCPNTEKRVENMTRNEVFLIKFEVFG